MSAAFFEQLWIPAPDYHLDVGSGSHAQQTARAMQRLEPILTELQPASVLVYADANSTAAAALTAPKLGLPAGHADAGRRGRAGPMPDETNRARTHGPTAATCGCSSRWATWRC